MKKTIKYILSIFLGLLFMSPALYFYYTGCFTCIGLFIFPILFFIVWVFIMYNSTYNVIFLTDNPRNDKNIRKKNNIHRIIKTLILILLIWVLYYNLELKY